MINTRPKATRGKGGLFHLVGYGLVMVGTQDQILKAKAEADAMKEHYSLACPSHDLLSLLFYTTQVHFGVALMFPFTAITNQENAPPPDTSPELT